MSRLEKSSNRCKEEAEAMEKQFETWKEFVLNLHLAVTDSESMCTLVPPRSNC